jgi:hypothetical protein
MQSPATPRTVFSCPESIGGSVSGVARIISTPFLSRSSNTVPCGSKLFAAIYPAVVSALPACTSSSLSAPESIQSVNVLVTSSSAFCLHVEAIGGSSVFINLLSGESGV